jgi:NhaC family Na+:H+ antiporter
MAGVLGVATAAYLPYAFFNLLSPVISLIYGFTGFRIEHVDPPTEAPGPANPEPGPGEQLTEGSPS